MPRWNRGSAAMSRIRCTGRIEVKGRYGFDAALEGLFEHPGPALLRKLASRLWSSSTCNCRA